MQWDLEVSASRLTVLLPGDLRFLTPKSILRLVHSSLLSTAFAYVHPLLLFTSVILCLSSLCQTWVCGWDLSKFWWFPKAPCTQIALNNYWLVSNSEPAGNTSVYTRWNFWGFASFLIYRSTWHHFLYCSRVPSEADFFWRGYGRLYCTGKFITSKQNCFPLVQSHYWIQYIIIIILLYHKK